jgi:hypothetical protein
MEAPPHEAEWLVGESLPDREMLQPRSIQLDAADLASRADPVHVSARAVVNRTAKEASS